MERFFFKKIEVWFVALIVILLLLGTGFFGVVVRNATLGHDRFGVIGRIALAIAEVPANLSKLLNDENPMVAWENEAAAGKSGWQFSQLGNDFDSYVLLSRYDAEAARQIIELIDVRSRKSVYVWRPDADTLLEGVPRTSIADHVQFENWNTKYFRYIHPLLLQNGDLIVKDHESPLMRIDACANLKWRLDKDFYHHSTELDATGAIWVPARIEPSEVPGTSAEFLDEALFQVSLDGEILFKKSLTNILIDNGFERDLFAQGNYNRDPVHLNDIQPVLEDGPFWKRGDLFLSIRHLSMIALYRPSEDRIVWQQQGPWAAQHDVDILDENRIAIYNNNSYRYQRRGEPVVKGLNEIVVYDFRTDQVSRPWQPFFEKYNIKAFAEGLFEMLPGGYLLVDEATSARLLLLDRSGKMVAEFVNRASDGKVYHLGWSRIVSRELGDEVLASVRTKDCD